MAFCEQCGNKMYKFLLVPSGFFASDDDAAARKRKEIAAKLRGESAGNNETAARNAPPQPAIPFPPPSIPSNPFPPQPATNSIPIASAGRSSGKKQVSVLIVEDSALIRNLLGNIIEESPDLVTADKAMNGVFALSKIPRCNPDVILLDFDMPEMDGIEFLKERAKRGIKIPVVMLATDKVSKEMIGAALSLGASEYIMKPNSMSTANDKKIITDKLKKYGN